LFVQFDEPVRRKLVQAVADAVIAHAEELTDLDRAIGDGDHGLNMKRGFSAVLADLDKIAAQPLPKMLGVIGTTLVMKVGGASGPLFGTLFMQLGKSLPDNPSLPGNPSLADAAAALAAAIEAVKARGKSDVGSKTMLDVLAPLLAAVRDGAADLPAVADAAAEATRPMKALRGRASFLGDRSIGHVDPGARSSALIVRAICGVLEGNP
jgi:dihydroxyacetone kinase-like protein